MTVCKKHKKESLEKNKKRKKTKELLAGGSRDVKKAAAPVWDGGF
jgi:hypothetical protein